MSDSPISIRLLSAEHEARWDGFVRACPQSTFFHLSAWQGILERVFGHKTWYLYAERNTKIIAVLPLAQIRSLLFGNSLSSLPFCAYGGIVGDGEAAASLEEEARRIASEIGADYLEYRNFDTRHGDWPTQTLYASFRKTILPSDEENLKAIPRKQRAMVRKGIKQGLKSEIDANADRFYSLYSDNVRRHGTPPFSKAYFDQLLSSFGGDCDILTVVDADGRPLSSVLSFYFRDEVLPYYAGDHIAARSVAANDFKYWELMRRARLRECKSFDYGRSKRGTGPWNFKKNWGCEPKPLSYEYELFKGNDIPQKNPLNSKYRLFVALWKRLPLRVANAIGPCISRQLG